MGLRLPTFLLQVPVELVEHARASRVHVHSDTRRRGRILGDEKGTEQPAVTGITEGAFQNLFLPRKLARRASEGWAFDAGEALTGASG